MRAVRQHGETWLMQVRFGKYDPWETVGGGTADAIDNQTTGAGACHIRAIGYQIRAIALDALGDAERAEAGRSMRERAENFAGDAAPGLSSR
jgi:hypothetical protein